MSDPATTSDLDEESLACASLCSSTAPEARYSSTGRGYGYSLEIKDFIAYNSGKRAGITQQLALNHSLCFVSDSPDRSTEISFGNSHLPQAEEVIAWMRTHILFSKGATYYLNSTLQTQVWTLAMIEPFTPKDWDVWTAPLPRLFTCSELRPLDPCRVNFLGDCALCSPDANICILRMLFRSWL